MVVSCGPAKIATLSRPAIEAVVETRVSTH